MHDDRNKRRDAILRAGIVAIAFLLVAFALQFAPNAATAQGTQMVAFVGARVITGDGRTAFENGTLLVRAGKIVQVGASDSVKVPKDAMRVDLAGKTVMPMLEELHIHAGYMKNGVTGSECGSDSKGIPGGHVSKDFYSRENVLDELRRFRYYGIGAVQSLGADRNNNTELTIRNEQRSGKLSDPDALALLFTAGKMES